MPLFCPNLTSRADVIPDTGGRPRDIPSLPGERLHPLSRASPRDGTPGHLPGGRSGGCGHAPTSRHHEVAPPRAVSHAGASDCGTIHAPEGVGVGGREGAGVAGCYDRSQTPAVYRKAHAAFDSHIMPLDAGWSILLAAMATFKAINDACLETGDLIIIFLMFTASDEKYKYTALVLFSIVQTFTSMVEEGSPHHRIYSVSKIVGPNYTANHSTSNIHVCCPAQLDASRLTSPTGLSQSVTVLASPRGQRNAPDSGLLHLHRPTPDRRQKLIPPVG